jgi:DNA-binding transcriptional ArsR family regulator
MLQNNSEKLIRRSSLIRAVNILKAVAHPARLQIVALLLQSEYSAKEFAAKIGLKQTFTSQQLKTLKYSGVVNSHRDGTSVYYSLANTKIKKIIQAIVAET